MFEYSHDVFCVFHQKWRWSGGKSHLAQSLRTCISVKYGTMKFRVLERTMSEQTKRRHLA